MLEPFKDIRSASVLLDAALKQYLAVCSVIDSHAHPIPKSLAHLVENELLMLDSFETIIRRARSALGRAKNYSPAMVPINSLPSEILSRIFLLILDTSCRDYNRAGSVSYTFPRYPDTFLHVCSRWRQIALGSHMFWSHIDIIPRYVATTGLLARAETLVSFAGQSMLELHISGTTEPDMDSRHLADNDHPLFQFLTSIAPRLESLELATHLFTRFHLSVLETCFVNCTPGVLTRLIIQLPNGSPLNSESKFGFLEAAEAATGFGGRLQIDMPQEDLEALWLPVETLYLCGIYPPWSSKAYHGLVELRLLSLQPDRLTTRITIPETQLVDILNSSPQLRVLCLGMEIDEPLPDHVSVTPVHLNNLEVIDLTQMPLGQNGTILRWLVTGENPPIVALKFCSSASLLSDEEVQQFFARSHIARLAVTGPYSNDWSPGLLSLSPHLQSFAFKNLAYYSDDTSQTIPFPQEYDLPPIGFRQNYLRVIFCLSVVDIGWLRQVLERWPIQMIALWACSARRNGQVIPDNEVESELLQVCPVVRILDYSEPNPIADWHLLD